MRKILSLIATVFILSGCSVYYAAKAPSSVDYKKVKVGQARAETISILGLPKMTNNIDNKKVDIHEFRDGFHGASKARILLYLAGDFFTLTLAEIIFWPLETNAFDGKLCRGTINYDDSDHIKSFDILDSEGESLWRSSL
jgi:hypothetical protein